MISTVSFSQEFQGRAYYFSKTIFSADLKEENSESKKQDPAFEKALQEALKEASEKSYLLTFNKSECIYEQEQQLEKPKAASGEMQISVSISSSEGKKYINAKNKTSSIKDAILGKEFLIVEPIEKPDWELVDESKKIGDYTCFKATAIKEASKTDFRNYRRKKEAPKKDAEEGKVDEKETSEKKEEKKTNFFEDIDMPKEVTVTAWYCPEIPVNQGPDEYWGLPGLIMEVNDGKTIIMCSKLVLNVKEKIEIKAPTGGDKVSQKEYDDIMIKKMKEMSEMGGGPGSRGGMQMRISR